MPAGKRQVTSEVNFAFGESKHGYQWRASMGSPLENKVRVAILIAHLRRAKVNPFGGLSAISDGHARFLSTGTGATKVMMSLSGVACQPWISSVELTERMVRSTASRLSSWTGLPLGLN
jgi:hypothetical protein